MSIRVLHIVEDEDGSAGWTGHALDGLAGPLRASDIQSEVMVWNGSERVGSSLARGVSGSDLVHVHGVAAAALVEVIQEVRRSRRACVVSPLGTTAADPYVDAGRWERWMSGIRLRRALRAAAVVGAVNEAQSGELAVIRGLRVRVLPYGLDTEGYRNAGDDRGSGEGERHSRYVLCLGPIDPIEGLLPLIRSVAELGHDFKGWKLVVAGPERGRWRRKLESAIERKRASDRVTFVVDPDRAAQRSLLRGASVLVAPSLRTRCPVSVAQAVALGVPVVASPHGLPPGAESVIRVCPPERAALRDSLRPLVTCSDDERIAIGARVREVGTHVFDWSRWVDAYVDVYRGAMRDGGA